MWKTERREREGQTLAKGGNNGGEGNYLVVNMAASPTLLTVDIFFCHDVAHPPSSTLTCSWCCRVVYTAACNRRNGTPARDSFNTPASGGQINAHRCTSASQRTCFCRASLVTDVSHWVASVVSGSFFGLSRWLVVAVHMAGGLCVWDEV